MWFVAARAITDKVKEAEGVKHIGHSPRARTPGPHYNKNYTAREGGWLMIQINWDNFRTYNQDARGVRFKFEDLCRQLFANENLSNNKQFKYLHSNPNNYGLEAEPIFDESRQLWIGFQAKFFDNAVGYNKIQESAEKIVEYYTGKAGKVDLVYLFCNKPITSTAETFVSTVNLLKKHNIELQLITDTAILDLVINKYPYLGLYYFCNHTINFDWFITHANHMYDDLGERYNRKFNVETDFLDELSLFVHDQRAVDCLNTKKKELLEEIDKQYWKRDQYRSYLYVLREAILSLTDVTSESLCTALEWQDIVKQRIQTEREKYAKAVESLKREQKEAYDNVYNNAGSKEAKSRLLEKAHELGRQIDDLTVLIDLPEAVAITDRERSLLQGKVMLLSGRAGTGKSQLLATKTKTLLDAKRTALLLVAGIYFTADPIQEQIIKNLRLDFRFEELIDVLETIGEKNNCIVPVFIDAINETWNNKLWKTGLPLIADKVKHAPMVRLVVSYRPEYENIVIPDSMSSAGGDIVRIYHCGFEDNSIAAVREFLNYYNIPFTPLEYFGYEMSNPLFLTLYCKTYNGEEVSLPTLYERLIEKANANIYSAREEDLRRLGYSANDDLLLPLIIQIAEYLVTHDERSISKAELSKLSYWTEYGLTPPPYITCLIKENILHDTTFDNVEKLYFAYDQMNDYYCAKAIMDMRSTKDEVRQYLSEKVLGIENNKLGFSRNIDLFVNTCVLYAEKYGEECIDVIDTLTEDNERWEVFSRYVKSFEWRKTRAISRNIFTELLNKYPCGPDDLWPMLIGNSVKVSHPFNADFLHEFLSRYKLNRRDYLWTAYVNKLTWDDSDRVVQLIQMYDRGEKLEVKNEKQVELLLTLFAWILTSTNRWLRDYTSKAMIEILKENFDLCKPLLEKFKNVNDPYVVQRLYGVIFGACCKRKVGSLKELAECVYQNVFNQDKVYPDILLRDYARLIIEKFLTEEPGYRGIIERDKIVPPYTSDPIPDIDDQHYQDIDYNGAMLRLVMSMRIEKLGGYGDFGRYVFQSKLSSFDVDMYKMYNYAIYHIINDLGFSEDLFGDHDKNVRGYDRHLTVKTERIGKKYQWITLYEMLARVSDHCKMIDRWNFPAVGEVKFEGAWDPYVRDFDPTLNSKFMVCNDAPIFKALEDHRAGGIEENKTSDISTPELSKAWMEHKGIFYKDLKDTLILTDDSGEQWVSLTKYCDTGRENLDIEKLSVWSWLYAYFMTSEQADAFLRCAERGLPVISNDIASHHETYVVFNREYPWSPSCKQFEEYAWVNAHLKTGEKETITETIQVPDYSAFEALLRRYSISEEDEKVSDDELIEEDEEEKLSIPEIKYKEETIQREVELEIGKILHTTTELLWEEEYDATKEEAISRSFPCGELIKTMGLRQMNADGFFYDAEGKLAAFDTNLTQKVNSVVVRKDILDCFLSKTGWKLVWVVDAEKEIHARDFSIISWSDWEAVFVYEGDHIVGDIHWLPEGNRW